MPPSSFTPPPRSKLSLLSPNSELQTPNYRMPAEWEPHEATWLAWPENAVTWPGRLLAEVRSVYLRMIFELLKGEKVHLLVKDEATAESVLKAALLARAETSRLVFHCVRAGDAWIRDYGPIFVTGRLRGQTPLTPGQVGFTKWTFNAWGGKYRDLARDNGVVDQIPFLKKYRRLNAGMVLEGGSIDVNGRGTCLTTEQCLLISTRNPKLSRRDIERRLGRYLGIKKVIWLGEGIEGDDTDGHVDDIARFVGSNTVVAAAEEDRADSNHAVLKKNLEILRASRDCQGKRLRVIELPMPGRVIGARKRRLPASYANFYAANGLVLVPVYSHPNDRIALSILRRAFPGRRVVGIECTSLVFGLGAIHCITQQEPA
ncbi:MAG: agmatine deiminase family protein [Candidatus Omnitrophica bacterium]|nr:agmatine deiminase family protein [Candidatus Omnitrophota bacterium]